MRWPLRQRPSGRLPSLGQDYREGHRRYVERKGAGGERWLRTKPFSAPPGHELLECLRTFSHAVDRLGLDLRAQVLDVGCGPGWMSEYLARCGYWVTGVDVSEDMVEIARERLARIREPVGVGIDALAEFHALPVLELPWSQRFDAAILYDAMHHFDDEVETLRVILRSLAPGGRIFIHEGVRPEPGSEGERELIAEMEEFGTLESPFDSEYLVKVLGKAGFEQVMRFAAVDELLDVSERALELERLEARMAYPTMNTLIAVNPVPGDLAGDGSGFLARIEAESSWEGTGQDRELALSVTLTNVGRRYWPGASGAPLPYGAVTIGPYVPGFDGNRRELPRFGLSRSLSSGDSIGAELRISAARVEGASEVAIDLVREGMAWFAEYGSTPLVVPLPDRG